MKPSHRPKKQLGQNFLNNPYVLQKIVDACGLTEKDIVVEIGPGKGALTRLLAPKVEALHAVEFDRDLLDALRLEFDGDNVHIIQGDFLSWDFTGLATPVKVIGNIPYYISTPIIEHLLEHRTGITEAFLTVQKEFGERLAAKPGGKDYGSLSCFIQYYADVQVMFKIKNTCFNPPPRVDSCFVRLHFHSTPIHHPKDEKLMFTVISTAFTQRRKNILNALASLIDKEKLSTILIRLKLSPQARPETLSLQNYIAIADALC